MCRELLRRWGYEGVVKSPSWTLIESYETEKFRVHHLDAYRLKEGEERELGLENYLEEDAVMLIEWAEKLGRHKIQVDLMGSFSLNKSSSRSLELQGASEKGRQIVRELRGEQGGKQA